MKIIREAIAGSGREAVLVGLGLSVAYLFVRMSPYVAIGAFGDDGVYVALGKALASGEGYRSIYAVGQPVHIKYPPGVPSLFALIWWLGGDLTSVERLVSGLNLIVCGLSAALVWKLGREQLKLRASLVLAFGIAPFFLEVSIQYFNLAISEPYYVLFWLAALNLYYRLDNQPTGPKRIAVALALGILTAAATLVRAQGIVLLPAFLLALVVERVDWRSVVAYTATSATPLLVWLWVHGAMVARGPISGQPDEGSYGSWIPTSAAELPAFLASAVASNWRAYWNIIPAHLSDIEIVGIAFCAGFLILATMGGARLIRRHLAFVLTTLGNVALIMAWPYAQDRFALTVLPLTGLLIAVSLRDIGRRLPLDRRFAYALLVAVALPIIVRQVNMRRAAFGEEQTVAGNQLTYPGRFLAANTRYLLAASSWVIANTRRADRILIEVPAGLYLHTGRRGVSSAPAESQLGPSIFQRRGRFLAERIREDSLTVVALGGLGSPLASDVAAFQRECPNTLEFVGTPQREAWPRFYRVARDEECMSALEREVVNAAPR